MNMKTDTRVFISVYTKRELFDMLDVWLNDKDIIEVSWPVKSSRQMTLCRFQTEAEMMADENISDS